MEVTLVNNSKRQIVNVSGMMFVYIPLTDEELKAMGLYNRM